MALLTTGVYTNTTYGNIGIVNYLDNISGKGRRVDLNLVTAYGANGMALYSRPNDTTTTGLVRASLKALLWAAKKIN